MLDAGCGWGELLVRVVEAAPAAHGIGIDLDTGRIEEARRRAEARGVADRVTFTDADASDRRTRRADAVVAIGSSQVWGAESEEPGPLDYAAALAALRAGVRRGGRVVYGEGIWSRPPTRRPSERSPGWTTSSSTSPTSSSSPSSTGSRSPESPRPRRRSGTPSSPATAPATPPGWPRTRPTTRRPRRSATRGCGQRAAYLRGYRGVLGLAYLQLIAV